MRRRNFIAGLASTTAAWPVAARAQQSERASAYSCRPRKIQKHGLASPRSDKRCRDWAGPTVATCNIDTRFAAGNAADLRKYAAELAALAPDVILSIGSAGLPPVLQATRTVPIVFVLVPDPVGSGFVHSLSRPGGNATGFTMFEYNLCGKWLEL